MMNGHNVAKYFNNSEVDDCLKLIPQMEGRCLITREDRRPHKVWLSYKLFGQGRTRVFLVPSSEVDENDMVKLIQFFGSSPYYQLCIYNSVYDSLNSLSVEFDQTRIHSLAHDYFGLLNFLGWSRCVHLLGISNGCLIADRMAILDPLRFTSVSLVNHIPNAFDSESCKSNKLNQGFSHFKEWSQKFNLTNWSKQLNNKRSSKFIKLLHNATPIEDLNASQVTIQSNLNPVIDIYGMCIDGMSKRRLKIFAQADCLNQCMKIDVDATEEGYSDEYVLLKGCHNLRLMDKPDSLNNLLKAQFDAVPLDEYVQVPLISTGPKKWTLSYDEGANGGEHSRNPKKQTNKRSLSSTILKKRLSVWNIMPSFNNLKPLEKSQVY